MANAEVSALSGCEVTRVSESIRDQRRASVPRLEEVERASPGRQLWRSLADGVGALLHDDLSDRVDQIPEYRNARARALQYAMLRNINR